MDHLRKVVAYRNRAEECRIMARDFSDGGRRRVLEGLSEDYSKMADELEAFLKAHPARGVCSRH